MRDAPGFGVRGEKGTLSLSRLHYSPVTVATVAVALTVVGLPSCSEQNVGSRILFDQGHYNYHTPETYMDLVTGLEAREYTIATHDGPFNRGVLGDQDILVIANPLAEDREMLMSSLGDTWSHTERANRTAFTDAETRIIAEWVRGGGALFLVSDHYPYGRSVASLASQFGVSVSGGLTRDTPRAIDGGGGNWIYFSLSDGLGDHEIIMGDGRPETRVERVETFTGTSLIGPPHSTVLLALSEDAQDWIPPAPPDTAWVTRSAGGRAMALVLCHGRGRVFISGEAGMFARLSNADNAPFAFNAFEWLREAGTGECVGA